MNVPVTSGGRERRLRVLYFIGSYGPDAMGSASHEQTILALRERGYHVDVFTQITDPAKPRYSRVEYSGVTVFRVNLAAKGGRLSHTARALSGRLFKYDYLFPLLSAYRRHLRRHRYDLVHAEGAYPFGFIAALGRGQTPYLANVQGADVIDLPEADYGYRRFRLPRAAVKLALSRAALIRVISPLLLDYLEEQGLATANRVEVVLRALEDDAYPPAGMSLAQLREEGRRLLAEKHGIGLARPVILALSRLHPFKGLEYLIDAMPSIVSAQKKEGKPAPWFVICGPSRSTEHYGDYREFLMKRAESLGMASHLIFTGQVPHEEVRSYLAGTDILVCPSIIEAQNKVVPEACAVGTPSVATDTTGITKYLVPKDACVSVPPRSAQAIADAVLRLLSDQDYYQRISRNALRMAETLRADAIAPQLEAVWQRAAR
ncbi:MAG TPA: glycosyltransferase family 4 protein [Chloroflexia bacterium]|nr:glycosyltransferase family 4 protein [Chloroflexia bacterium]